MGSGKEGGRGDALGFDVGKSEENWGGGGGDV